MRKFLPAPVADRLRAVELDRKARKAADRAQKAARRQSKATNRVLERGNR
jgi:hypothetical protein